MEKRPPGCIELILGVELEVEIICRFQGPGHRPVIPSPQDERAHHRREAASDEGLRGPTAPATRRQSRTPFAVASQARAAGSQAARRAAMSEIDRQPLAEDDAMVPPRTSLPTNRGPTTAKADMPALESQVPEAISITATATAAASNQRRQHPIPWRCCTHRTDGLHAHHYASPGVSGCRTSVGRSPSGTVEMTSHRTLATAFRRPAREAATRCL